MIKTWTQSVRACLRLTLLSHVHPIFQNFDCFFVIDNDREYFLWEMWPPDDKNNLERLMFLPDACVFTGRCSVFVCEIKPSETKRDRVSVCHRQNGIFNERLGLLPCFKQHHIDLGAGRWRVARFCFSCTGGVLCHQMQCASILHFPCHSSQVSAHVMIYQNVITHDFQYLYSCHLVFATTLKYYCCNCQYQFTLAVFGTFSLLTLFRTTFCNALLAF